MLRHRKFGLPALLTVLLQACQPQPADVGNTEQAIVAQERRALDRWAQGNPLGYLEVDADDVTYFDDIGAHSRIDGIEAMRNYFTSLQGKIPPHKYEIVDPKVQVYGEIGILTLRYKAYATDGKTLAHWKATSVYRRMGGEWRVVHAHWSIVKE
jgi:ketosteroid isomerase-like protein